MINLTHDDSSCVDLDGDWIDDVFILRFRINRDDEDDIEVGIMLDSDELETLIDYLHTKARRKLC